MTISAKRSNDFKAEIAKLREFGLKRIQHASASDSISTTQRWLCSRRIVAHWKRLHLLDMVSISLDTSPHTLEQTHRSNRLNKHETWVKSRNDFGKLLNSHPPASGHLTKSKITKSQSTHYEVLQLRTPIIHRKEQQHQMQACCPH